MSFTRADFYGLNLDWYAVDADGHVAQFTTGYGPVPRSVFADEAAYNAAYDYFQSSGPVCSSLLFERARSRQAGGIGDYSVPLAEARRGLFVFDEEEYGPIHCLHAIPNAPLHLASLPARAQEFVSQFYLNKVRFINADAIDVLEHFDCVR